MYADTKGLIYRYDKFKKYQKIEFENCNYERKKAKITYNHMVATPILTLGSKWQPLTLCKLSSSTP